MPMIFTSSGVSYLICRTARGRPSVRLVVGHAFEIAVPGRAAGHVDHVDLPEPFVGVGIPRMPFETLVLRVEQVSVLDATDAGIFGQPGHGGEAVGHAER